VTVGGRLVPVTSMANAGETSFNMPDI